MKKSKIFKVIDTENGSHEFDIITIKKDKMIVYAMWFSDSTVWTNSVRDELVFKCTDTGNELKFEFNDDLTNNEFDLTNFGYDKAYILQIFFQFYYSRKNNDMGSYGFLKVKE